MARKILISLIIAGVLTGSFVFYAVLKYRDNLRITRQKVKAEQISVTFVEGWNLKEIASYLEKNGIVSAAEFIQTAKNFNTKAYPLLKTKPSFSNLEGYLFPDTYFILKNPPQGTNVSEVIIKKALENFEKKVSPEIAKKTAPLNLYESITLASIIEKETGSFKQSKEQIDKERRIVAGIFYNRLNIGMPLQSDATVNYATGKSAFQASSQDISIDSPYNTYKYVGLPTGPISNPSLSSIVAALNPAKTEYMYFLTDPKTGQAVFAKTFEEHKRNREKYLR